MFAVRIIGKAAGFDVGQIVPVFDEPPNDDTLVRTEADFEISALALELRQWLKSGRSEEEFRTMLHDACPLYENVEFPGRLNWLLPEAAQTFIDLGVAQPIEMGSAEAALEAWGL